MAAINITPVASSVTIDNLPKLGGQYLALLVLDHVVNETLGAKTTFFIQYMDQLVRAMASALGSHHRMIKGVSQQLWNYIRIGYEWHNLGMA